MDQTSMDNAAATYGGTIKDTAGRPAAERKPGAGDDGPAPVAEQLDRILPQGT